MSTIRRQITLCFVFVAVLAAPFAAHAQNPFSSGQRGYPNWSAFTGIKWEKGRPIVQFKDEWFELVSIHGVTTEAILKKCKEEDWDTGKRVAEDLVQILRLMGQEVDKKTDLVLRDKDGKKATFKDVAMTEDNRRRLMRQSRETRRRPARPSSPNPFLSSAPGYPEWSAFTGVKWKGDQPIVEVDGKWYELLKFDGLTVKEIS